MSFIERGNEPPYYFADTFEVLNIVSFATFNCLTENVKIAKSGLSFFLFSFSFLFYF